LDVYDKEGLEYRKIHTEINNVLRSGTVAYSNINRYLLKRSFSQPSEIPSEYLKIDWDDSIDVSKEFVDKRR
jgi:hypothetical protein